MAKPALIVHRGNPGSVRIQDVVFDGPGLRMQITNVVVTHGPEGFYIGPIPRVLQWQMNVEDVIRRVRHACRRALL